jgi:hypothetical protein
MRHFHSLSRAALAAALLGGVCAARAADEQSAATSAEADGLDFELSADFCTRQIARGLPDNTDPILTLAATAEWNGFFTEVDALFNMTDIAEEEGFDAWDNTEIDVVLGYEYTLETEGAGPIALGFDYTYEYDQGGDGPSDHVSYLHASVGFEEVPLSPTLSGEWMLDGVHGQYYTFELSHSFALVGDEEGTGLALTLTLVQGLANDKYNEDDLGRDSWGFRETTLLAELEWTPAEHLTVTPYVAYGDHVNGGFRHAAHYYADEACRHHVAQLYGGVAVGFTF